MASVNKVMIIGTLGKDPEVRHTPAGASVCTLSIATTETWSDNGNKQERTEWHRVIVWGKQGENCAKFLSKGKSCFVEGRLQTRSWDDKDGSKRYATEIVAQYVQFLSAREKSGEDSSSTPPPSNSDEGPQHAQHSSLDDLPF